MDTILKSKILSLFHEGKTCISISKELRCAKSTVSYHCSKFIPKDERYTEEKLKKYQRHYDIYGSSNKTAKYFNVSAGTLKHKLILRQKKYTPEENKIRRSRSVCEWRKRLKIRAVSHMGGRCQICTYDKSICAFEFHHINPIEKDFGMAHGIKSWDKVQKELEKCILVCKNCHAEIHEEIYLKGFSDMVNCLFKRDW